VAGDDQQHDHAEELGLAQGVAALLGLEQCARQVVAGFCAPLCEQIAQVRNECVEELPEARQPFGVERRCDDRSRPFPEAVAVESRAARRSP
jgi:hypothetical protein